jgi:hypothetical protein
MKVGIDAASVVCFPSAFLERDSDAATHFASTASVRKQQQNIERRSSEIDYREVLAAADRRWPFAQFAKPPKSNMSPSQSFCENPSRLICDLAPS